VDLDFNYVGALERDTMLAERPEVERALLALARSSACHVQHSRDAFAGRKFFPHYHGAFGVRDRIEVDLNFFSRGRMKSRCNEAETPVGDARYG
jgi:hypothetical protein